jgi:hypothetical protein
MPPAAWKKYKERTGYNLPEIPFGSMDINSLEPKDESLVPLKEASTADCLIGLTKFKYKIWEPSEVEGHYTCPPIRRDFVGRPTRHVPMLGDFGADWATAFTKTQVKQKNLPADVKEVAQKRNMLDDKYRFQHDRKGLWTVQWSEKSGDGKPDSGQNPSLLPPLGPMGSILSRRFLRFGS